MSILSKPYFHDEARAFGFVESVLWPNGPVCPHCKATDRIYVLKGVLGKPKISKETGEVLAPGKPRLGLKKCGHCRKQFTVRVGTVFESSHAPLCKWLQATHLLCSSKKGISAHQLHRVLEVQYNTAWFMAHRLRLAMASGELNPFGAGGGAVEVDETFIGYDASATGKHARSKMNKVLTLIDRTTGQARSMVVKDLRMVTVAKIVWKNVSREARFMTDQAHHYWWPGIVFVQHGVVNHSQKEWVSRDDPTVHTQTIEGFFSIFKRGMRGVYQHCSPKHLHRYLAEFDFRYSNRIRLGVDDQDRATKALRGVVGKRLTYREAN